MARKPIAVMRAGTLWFDADPRTGKAIRHVQTPPPRDLEAERLDEIANLHRQADQAPNVIALAYFVGGQEGPVKIGYSIDVKHRLVALRISSPVPLGLLAVAPGGKAREQAYHAQFAHLRLHGEWFERAPELVDEIERLANPFRDNRSRARSAGRGREA